MDIFKFLQNKLTQKPQTITVEQLKSAGNDKNQFDMLSKFGVVQSDLGKALEYADLIAYERQSLYAALDKSLVHPLMSAAPSLFADVATNYNRVQNGTVWGTSKNREYEYQLKKFLDIINIEEVIYDWAWTIATFGDLFVAVHGEPGVGIISVNDDDHPVNNSRVDYNGRLIGFYSSPGGLGGSVDRKLENPWSKVHFRLLGARRRRAEYGGMSSNFSEYRTVNIMSPDARRLTSKYGTSVLADALPIFKRLRLAEDSIMMARITRGVLRYMYKIGIDKSNSNNEAITSLIDNYVATLKEARSFNLDSTNPSFASKFNGMNAIEDIILPVFGDVNQITVEKLGGDVDIKWIEDVDMLTKQLSTALKVPLPLLAGYAEAANGGMGQNSLEKLDIRFARQTRRIQRALITGITRLFQIHLSYQGINPDMSLFQIHMSETSTAEELEMQEALDKGVDTTNKVMELLEKVLGVDFNKEEAIKYLNEKFLKLNDMDLEKLKLKTNTQAFDQPDERLEGLGDSSTALSTPSGNPFKAAMGGTGEEGMPETPAEEPTVEPKPKEEPEEEVFQERTLASDLKSMLPLNESQWTSQWGTTVIKIEEKK